MKTVNSIKRECLVVGLKHRGEKEVEEAREEGDENIKDREVSQH